MTTPAASCRPRPEVIDLSSDDSDDSLVTPSLHHHETLDFDDDGNLSPIDEQRVFDALIAPDPIPARDRPALGNAHGGQIINIDGEDVFIPDEEEAPQPGPAPPQTITPAEVQDDNDIALAFSDDNFSADSCLQKVLQIFPEVNHEHVIKLYNDFDNQEEYENLPGPARLDNIIEQLVSSSYPKQEKGKQTAKKRKRVDSIDETELKKWEREDREAVPVFLNGPMRAILKVEFPEITNNFINETLATKKHFYQSYLALANAKDSYDPTKPAYGKGRPARNHLANADTIAMNSGWPELIEELAAARKRVHIMRAQRLVEDAKKKAEQENLHRAMEAGETAECSACFDDLPMNRQIHCDGAVAHFTCYECAETYIKSEVGESRCRVLCTAGCGAAFAPNQLNQLEDKQLLQKLAELEQEKAIRDAGLDDLEECPFCDYKAILPPVEEDFEFRCANPECEKVSCRRCKSLSHIPISCEQHAKDNKIDYRHKIEEAMTAALIRSCNKCKKHFIKEYGCNKMTCPSCANLQCYVCSKSLTNYDHFEHTTGRATGTGKKCPLYDNVEERHEREVKEAGAAARAAVVAENPDVSAEDLEIKVSDAVKKSTADRIKQGGGADGGLGLLAFPMPGRNAMRVMIGADADAAEDGDADEEDALGFDAYMPAAARRAMRNMRGRRPAAAPRVPVAPRDLLQPPVAPRAAPVQLHQQPQPAMQGFIPVYGFGEAAAVAPQFPHRVNHPPPAPVPLVQPDAPRQQFANAYMDDPFADWLPEFFRAGAAAGENPFQEGGAFNAVAAAPPAAAVGNQQRLHGLPGIFPGYAPPPPAGAAAENPLVAHQQQRLAMLRAQREQLVRTREQVQQGRQDEVRQQQEDLRQQHEAQRLRQEAQRLRQQQQDRARRHLVQQNVAREREREAMLAMQRALRERDDWRGF